MPKKTFHLSKETLIGLDLLLKERQYHNPNALVNNILQELALIHKLRQVWRDDAIETLKKLGYNVQFMPPRMVTLTDEMPIFHSKKSPEKKPKLAENEEKGITGNEENG